MAGMRDIYIVTRRDYTPSRLTHRFEVASWSERSSIEAVKDFLNISRDSGQYSARAKIKDSLPATILVA